MARREDKRIDAQAKRYEVEIAEFKKEITKVQDLHDALLLENKELKAAHELAKSGLAALTEKFAALTHNRPFNSSHGHTEPPAVPGYAAPGAAEEMPEG